MGGSEYDDLAKYVFGGIKKKGIKTLSARGIFNLCIKQKIFK